VDVQPLSGDAWQLKRDLRLAALKDSPAAFASTYVREAGRGEDEWRGWPRGGQFFAAFDGATIDGQADGRAVDQADEPAPVGIAAAWVAAPLPFLARLLDTVGLAARIPIHDTVSAALRSSAPDG
jgi:hypothetical protein